MESFCHMWSMALLRVFSTSLDVDSSRAKIVDPTDRKRVLPVGTRGELAVSGYLVMKGYWGDTARTAEALIADDKGKFWMHVSGQV